MPKRIDDEVKKQYKKECKELGDQVYKFLCFCDDNIGYDNFRKNSKPKQLYDMAHRLFEYNWDMLT